MARDWQDLFITDASRPPRTAPSRRASEERRGFFRRLRENMRKTRQALAAEVQATLFDDLDEETWERLEEALIYADVGARTTAEVVEQLEQRGRGGRARRRRGADRAPGRAARRAAARDRRRPHRPPPAPDGDPGRRRQRHRQDDHDRQARLAPAPASWARRSCSAPPTRSAPPPSSSSRSGPSAPACDVRHGAPERRPGRGRLRRRRRGARARRRRRDRRHRRAACTPRTT